MKNIVLALVLFFTTSITSSSFDMQRMRIVQTLIDSAKTQEDLNAASKMLFEIWQDELAKKEQEVCRMTPGKFAEKFKHSMNLWRQHVEEMSKIRAELFKNDLMEPNYYKLKGIESKVNTLKRAKNMKPYVYNMSRAIYYEEKWIELDILVNTR